LQVKFSLISAFSHRPYPINPVFAVGFITAPCCWFLLGQERFGNMTRVYYKEAVGALVVFDVTRVSTFEAVTKWKNDIDAKVVLPDGKPIPVVLLANKVIFHLLLRVRE